MQSTPENISLHPHHYPQPDAEGITAVKALYKAERGRDLTDEEAHRVLAATMRFLWALNLPAGAKAAGATPNPAQQEALRKPKITYP